MRLLQNRPKSRLRRIWMNHQFDFICGFAAFVFVMFVYHSFSDGDFSFLMTLGSIISFIAFALLLVKVFTTKSVSAISLKTLQGYALVFAFRLCSILVYEGYLPFDRTGDWFYQACEVAALVLVILLIIYCTVVYRNTYSNASDNFTVLGVPERLGILVLAVPALVLAAIMHPSLNNNWFTDTAWTFALYLEAVAILPQIILFWNMSKKNQVIEVYERNYVFALATSRILHLIFWLSSFHELNDKYTTEWQKRYPGYLVVIAQIANVILMADYVYYHLLAARKKERFILPHRV